MSVVEIAFVKVLSFPLIETQILSELCPGFTIIEGVLRNKSKKDKIDSANKFLLRSEKITSSDFCIFNEVRKTRNSLVHESFKNKLTQNEIDGLRNNLMEKVHSAYKVSGKDSVIL